MPILKSAQSAEKDVLKIALIGVGGGLLLYGLIKGFPAIAEGLGGLITKGAGFLTSSLANAFPQIPAIGGNDNAGMTYTVINPQTGQKTTIAKDSSGNPVSTPLAEPSLNLIDPNTGQPVNLAYFQAQYPKLYEAIGKISLPSDYEHQYATGKTNVQPVAYSSIENQLSNIEEFQANIALGANPESGEFGSKYYFVAGSKYAVPLTPYEIAYDISHGIKLVESVH